KFGNLSAVAFMVGILILISCGEESFGQAGSTGGWVGNKNKTLSGSDRYPATEKESLKRKEHPETSLIGRWKWHASCNDGTNWEAAFVASGAENGNVSIDYIGALGGTGLGSVTGNRVMLSRTFAYVNQTWTA